MVNSAALSKALARSLDELRAVRRMAADLAGAHRHELVTERAARAAAEAALGALLQPEQFHEGSGECNGDTPPSGERAAPLGEDASDGGGPPPPGLGRLVDGMTYRACFDRFSRLEQERIVSLECDLELARLEAAEAVCRSTRDRARLMQSLDAAEARLARHSTLQVHAEAQQACSAAAAASRDHGETDLHVQYAGPTLAGSAAVGSGVPYPAADLLRFGLAPTRRSMEWGNSDNSDDSDLRGSLDSESASSAGQTVVEHGESDGSDSPARTTPERVDPNAQTGPGLGGARSMPEENGATAGAWRGSAAPARAPRRSVRRLSALGREPLARLEAELESARGEAAEAEARSVRELAGLQAGLDAARAESARLRQDLALVEAALAREQSEHSAARAALEGLRSLAAEVDACRAADSLATAKALSVAQEGRREAERLLALERSAAMRLREQLAAAAATAGADDEAEELRREARRLRAALAHAERLRGEAERALARTAADAVEERQSLEKQCSQLQTEAGRAWQEASVYISRIRSDLGTAPQPGGGGGGGNSPARALEAAARRGARAAAVPQPAAAHASRTVDS